MPVLDLWTLAGTHAVRVADGPTEADWLRWVGITISFIGACITAASGIAWLYRDIKAGTSRVASAARGKLAKFIPALRRSVEVQALSAMAQVSGSVAAAVAYGWDSNESTDQKIERLHKNVEAMRTDLNNLAASVQKERADLQDLIASTEKKLLKEIQRLERILVRAEGVEARADGRGLIPVAMGILLVGIPDGLSKHPNVGWAVLALAGLVTLVVTVVAIRDARRA